MQVKIFSWLTENQRICIKKVCEVHFLLEPETWINTFIASLHTVTNILLRPSITKAIKKIERGSPCLDNEETLGEPLMIKDSLTMEMQMGIS